MIRKQMIIKGNKKDIERECDILRTRRDLVDQLRKALKISKKHSETLLEDAGWNLLRAEMAYHDKTTNYIELQDMGKGKLKID